MKYECSHKEKMKNLQQHDDGGNFSITNQQPISTNQQPDYNNIDQSGTRFHNSQAKGTDRWNNDYMNDYIMKFVQYSIQYI